MKKHQKRIRELIMMCCLMFFSGQALWAQEDNLILQLDFEHTDGRTVSDPDHSGISATLMNDASVDQMGKFHILNLGNNTGYLDLTEKAGDLFRQTDNYTISMYYRVNEKASLSGAGFFL